MSEKKQQLSAVQRANYAVRMGCSIREVCTNCGNKIRTLIFQGTGVCSDDCRKDRDGDHEPARALNP